MESPEYRITFRCHPLLQQFPDSYPSKKTILNNLGLSFSKDDLTKRVKEII